ncbi:MAG TPA: response regulator transcription factor [Solirubrobacterales bacterium]|nr:response regulator transcription factor [Solirubrobacterales bacterium]
MSVPASNGRILVVEDEESISQPFAEALRRAGFEPLVTATAAGALELAASEQPDLVMLDLALPDGDGRDVCRELRRASDVPIMMLTARGTELDKIVGLELDPGSRLASLDGTQLDLSRKEFDLLAELMRNAGRVVKREELMSEVWDSNWFGSTKTLDVHIGWLRRKLGDEATRPGYIETVRGVGFRFAAPEVEAP